MSILKIFIFCFMIASCYKHQLQGGVVEYHRRNNILSLTPIKKMKVNLPELSSLFWSESSLYGVRDRTGEIFMNDDVKILDGQWRTGSQW